MRRLVHIPSPPLRYPRGVRCHRVARGAARGFALLIPVLLFGAVSAVIMTTLLLLGTNALRTSGMVESSFAAKAFADACAEEALVVIQRSPAFTGSGTLTFPGGGCVFVVASGGGEVRTVTASGTVGSVIRRVAIAIDQMIPTIRVTSWQEVAS